MPERKVYADDDSLRNALQLAQRLETATGRKPSEYLLASAVLELHERLDQALAGNLLAGVADEARPS